MTLSFSAEIVGRGVRCLIGTDRPLSAPVFCFSMMAPVEVVSGGTQIESDGGFAAVQLADLVPGMPHEVVVQHRAPEFRPANRAWLPLGPYLRHEGGCTPLPRLPAGVLAGPPRPAEEAEGLRLVPPPRTWQPAGGTADAGRGFHAVHGAPLRAVDDLARRTGLGPFLSPQGLRLELTRDPALLPEAYRIEIGAELVRLSHTDAAGAFYGAITLLQLQATHHGSLPCGMIDDAPRFCWRGQHLDCARHFYEAGTLHRLLDLMALLKLNRFHWHFADDEAFRLEIDTPSGLWERTAYRGEGEAVPGLFGGGIRSGGSYGPAMVTELLNHASTLHIQVLPEIEIPAHAFALNRVIPGLRDPGDTGSELSVQGYGANIVNPALPATWDFVIPLADAVAGRFPIGMLHLGCDELPHGAWDNSPAVTALKAREGLVDRDDVQGWMMERIAGHLAGKGIRPAAWEEAAKGRQGGIGHEAILFSWTGQGPGIEAARAGHDVVMCPAQSAYFDMAHTPAPDDWGACWAAMIPLEATVDWSPVPEGARDVAHRIIGVQGCFWSEFTTRDAEMEPMLAPRILGIACKAWETDGQTSGQRLRALANAWGPIFDKMGWSRNTWA